MPSSELVEIIGMCKTMEAFAARIYHDLSSRAETEELRQFWSHMHRDELDHIKFWEELFTHAQAGSLPEVFDDPIQMKAEIQGVQTQVETLRSKLAGDIGTYDAFILAYWLEFHMLHVGFESLFDVGKNTLGISLKHDYETHLTMFVEAFNRFCSGCAPELELMSQLILKLWRKVRQLAVMSKTDPLTGVLNRRGLFDYVNGLANFAQRHKYDVAMMMIDIDHFKNINDEHGHQIGDQVLKGVAQIIKHHIRASDIMGRYGGEEFLVFLPEVKKESISDLAEKIRAAVETGTFHSSNVTASIGVSHGKIGTDIGESVWQLVRSADTAMYEAKQSGRNCTVISNT